ncbi:DUF504 domain-containing protein [Methanobacterium alcaliphilum]|uniref:DUF504 domain-containing protein n=1 Tax=Methanobacterium alcaliphilum TaxID=392018 RepID=UPI00200B1CA4|nr:DUF504 domain-containing protein [Methanobacterium alcaliphilum]MCK9151411.1 DUF504 domain-containing protein [Methanobacterium alcaliphilum]
MAKHVLNLMLWHPKKDISLCNITYLHRGAHGNLKTVNGSQIKKLEKGFLILDEDQLIPYHRIVKIECKDNLIWKKCSHK